jgi:hypothetical protein
MKYLSNAFSVGMLKSLNANLKLTEIAVEKVSDLYATGEFVSVVGHQDTANLFTEQLGIPVSFNRATVKLEAGDQLILGQYIGPRLPEGTTVLPEGSRIAWAILEIN